MKISQLIERLEDMQDEFGDVDIQVEDFSERFHDIGEVRMYRGAPAASITILN